MDLKGKRVLVMGLGLHGGGLGVTRWLLRQGAQVTVTDLKAADALQPTLQALREDIRLLAGSSAGDRSGGGKITFVLGEHRESDFVNADLVVRNPGVPRESRFLALARAHDIPIAMEMDLFFERLPRGPDQVVGITGTKGKTTTTLMVGAILTRANPKTVVAGNLRVSALELLDRIDDATPVVLELSSFQLEGLGETRTSPALAAITNISPDHLNRYRDLDEYVAAKANIFRFQGLTDACILNFDDSVLTHLRPRVPSRVVWFSRTRPLHEGAYVEREAIMWNAGRLRETVLPLEELRVPGAHNVENALAATAVAAAWGASPALIAGALREFKGVPHRLETVRELDGVTFINDTTATTPAATLAALRALAVGPGRIILIAGGADKGLDYGRLAQAIAQLRARVVLLGSGATGSATLRIGQALDQAGASALVIARCDEFQDALLGAREAARPGDVVLLSPAAASFGMFANEFERGDRFRDLVNSW